MEYCALAVRSIFACIQGRRKYIECRGETNYILGYIFELDLPGHRHFIVGDTWLVFHCVVHARKFVLHSVTISFRY